MEAEIDSFKQLFASKKQVEKFQGDAFASLQELITKTGGALQSQMESFKIQQIQLIQTMQEALDSDMSKLKAHTNKSLLKLN